VPEPTVGLILKYAVNRWFYLYEQQQSFHYSRAYAYVALAEAAQPSPFALLSADERTKAAVFTLSHSADVFSHIFKKRNEAYWRKMMSAEAALEPTQLAWAAEKGWMVDKELGASFYTFTLPKGGTGLGMMSSKHHLSKAPIMALHYAHPHRERIKRNLWTSLDQLAQLVHIPSIPMASSVLHILIDQLAVRDIESAQAWEARLISYLKTNPQGDQAYAQELEWLYAQRVNPFELTPQEEVDFVKRSRVYLDSRP
jgi:hypothetical protein